MWIGPIAASRLAQGQVLDDDPFTKTKTVVSSLDDQTIGITQSNGQSVSVKIYDRANGLMVGSEWIDGLTKSDTTLRRDSLQ